MSERDSTRIALGPGGQILNVPKNEELLERIKATPLLSTQNLLELASFYQAYPTNEPLANHLALLAMRKLSRTPRILEAVTDSVGGEAADQWEDFWRGRDHDPEDQRGNKVVLGNKAVLGDLAVRTEYAVRFVSFSGIGLLIESSSLDDKLYIIGVSPDPHSLSD